MKVLEQKIKKINIIGNEIFSNEELIEAFELSEGSFFSFLEMIMHIQKKN